MQVYALLIEYLYFCEKPQTGIFWIFSKFKYDKLLNIKRYSEQQNAYS